MAEWRAVVGWEGLYEVSSDGAVRNARSGKLRKQSIGPRGYYLIGLYRPGDGAHMARVHRLVAMAFCPNPEAHAYVNHIDMDKLNNRSSNLEWISWRDNYFQAYHAGRSHGGVNPNMARKLSAQDVALIRARAEAGEKPKLIAADFPVTQSHIENIIKGKKRVRG